MKTKELTETLMQAIYKTSASVEAPENQNKDWRAGYAVGLTHKGDRFNAITAEWEERGEPETEDKAFKDWKRGFWSSAFGRKH